MSKSHYIQPDFIEDTERYYGDPQYSNKSPELRYSRKSSKRFEDQQHKYQDFDHSKKRLIKYNKSQSKQNSEGFLSNLWENNKILVITIAIVLILIVILIILYIIKNKKSKSTQQGPGHFNQNQRHPPQPQIPVPDNIPEPKITQRSIRKDKPVRPASTHENLMSTVDDEELDKFVNPEEDEIGVVLENNPVESYEENIETEYEEELTFEDEDSYDEFDNMDDVE